MPKKKDFDYQEEANSAPVAEVAQPKPFYTLAMWAGVLPIYKCSSCGLDANNEDDMILHILKHYPELQRYEILNNALKEKNK